MQIVPAVKAAGILLGGSVSAGRNLAGQGTEDPPKRPPQAAKPRRKDRERERDLCVPAGLRAHLRRVRHRPGQRLAFPLHRGAVRRRRLCADLSAVSGGHGSAHHGNGVCRGSGQPQEHHRVLPGAGAQGHQVALVWLVRHGGQLPADDVLYYHRRLAADVLLQDRRRSV